MKFGVFDHIDESGLAVGQQFEERLALIERYEQAGFHAYHLAEHHGTPLGHGPSPSVFIAAATQRTTTLRLGPLVYCLPLYHPLRLIEEVCMLDHLSEGRLQLGVGAGVSPIEVGFFEVDWESRRERFDETFEILLEGLASDVLTHHGPEHHFDAVPMTLARSSARTRRCGSGSRVLSAPSGRHGTRSTSSRCCPPGWSGRSPMPIGPPGRPAAARRGTSPSWASRA
jgi:alkanesulfonate monooxygenase SsuD/methylene tetrahydromethanopterin reductase-like flavin-dependent oxidoreductase (luciferase family)